MDADAKKPEGWTKCSNCTNEFEVANLVYAIKFPEDHEQIVALLSDRLNLVTCPVCLHQARIPVYPLTCIHFDAGIVCMAVPGGKREDVLAKLPSDFDGEVKAVADASELSREVATWINPIIGAITMAFMKPDEFHALPRTEQIERLPPLTLRVLKAQVDGEIHAVRMSGADPAKAQEYLRKIVYALIADHIERIVLEAARTGAMHDTLARIEALVPSRCITREVLDNLATRCRPLKAPLEGFAFMVAFRSQYMHACAAAVGGIADPRSKDWAAILRLTWIISKAKKFAFQLDSSFILPATIVKRITRFEDLWDVCLPEFDKQQQFEPWISGVQEMMTTWGFEDRFLELLLAVPFRMQPVGPAKPEDAQRLVKSYVAVISERHKFGESYDASVALGIQVGLAVRTFLVNGSAEAAMLLLETFMERAETSKDVIALVAIAAHSSESLNAHQHFVEGLDVTGRALNFQENIFGALQPLLATRFAVELGNCMRYARESEQALHWYKLAAEFQTFYPPGADREGDGKTLRMNIAIAQRDAGQYGEALETLQDIVSRDPAWPEPRHSLSVLFIAVGRPAAALPHIEHALAAYASGPFVEKRGNMLVSLAEVQRALGRHDIALACAKQALELVISPALKIQASAVAAHCRPETDEDREFQKVAATNLRRFIDDAARLDGLLVTALASLAEWLVVHGEFDEVASILQRVHGWAEEANVSLPWQIDSIESRLAHAAGELEAAWIAARSAMDKVDDAVPQLADSRFAAGWLSNKNELQARISDIGIECVRQGVIDANELLRVYEFINGRDLSARLNAVGSDPDEWLGKLSGSPQPARLFMFLDGGKHVAMLHATAAGQVELLPIDEDSAALKLLRERTVQSLKRANPSNLAPLDRAMKPWIEFTTRIGAAISPLIKPGDHVVFLPGRLMTSMPLHAMAMPDGRVLLEHASVSYAANFATLLAPEADARPSHASLIVMPKQNETEQFMQSMARVDADLEQHLRASCASFERVVGPDAGKSESLAAISRATEAVLLCHGFDGAEEHGYGICVAADGRLPPPMLAVDRDKSLRRFMITWPDFELLTTTPTVIVSVACSTGMTLVGEGGSRFGLEQTTFARGTRSLICPLWDVEQKASHAWLRYFYAARQEGETLSAASRSAALELKKEMGHFYFWAPFILNGALPRGNQDGDAEG